MRAARRETCLYNRTPVTGAPEGDGDVFGDSYFALLPNSTRHVTRIRHKKFVINKTDNVLGVRFAIVVVEGQ